MNPLHRLDSAFMSPPSGNRNNLEHEAQDSSMLRDATQNDPQVFDMVKSPDPPSKNMEEESLSRGELQSIPENFQ